MNIFDWLFALALILLFGTEFFALATKEENPKQTFTHKLIAWMRKEKTTRRRVMVGLFIGWLFYHFVFQYFR